MQRILTLWRDAKLSGIFLRFAIVIALAMVIYQPAYSILGPTIYSIVRAFGLHLETSRSVALYLVAFLSLTGASAGYLAIQRISKAAKENKPEECDGNSHPEMGWEAGVPECPRH
jgi:hypothetical protein